MFLEVFETKLFVFGYGIFIFYLLLGYGTFTTWVTGNYTAFLGGAGIVEELFMFATEGGLLRFYPIMW